MLDMASAGRRVEIALIPAFHNKAGQEILKFLIPYVKGVVLTKQPDIKRILNASEGKGVPESDLWFFKTLYHPKSGFVHIHEWSPESPDVAYIECVKFVLTVITIINGNLNQAMSVVKAGQDVKTYKGFQGIEGHAPPKDYIELVYTQMYEGQKFVPVEDVVCRELSAAFGDLHDGNTSEAVLNEHINRALSRLLEILDEKDCRNKEILKEIVGAIRAGGDIAGRERPIERARATIRELNDARFMEILERYIAEHPEITHVIMNIGASHYTNTVRLISSSRYFVLNTDMDTIVKKIHEEVGFGDMFRGTGTAATAITGTAATAITGTAGSSSKRSRRRKSRSRKTRKSRKSRLGLDSSN